jgi:hypothetical protein
VTRRTGIRNFVGLCPCRRNEPERMASHVHIRDGLFNLRHVARNTLAACAPGLVMRVLVESRRMRSVR